MIPDVPYRLCSEVMMQFARHVIVPHHIVDWRWFWFHQARAIEQREEALRLCTLASGTSSLVKHNSSFTFAKVLANSATIFMEDSGEGALGRRLDRCR